MISWVRGIGAGDRAEELRRDAALAHRRHRPAVAVRRLPLQPGPVDRPAVEPRRRAGLEPRQRQVQRAELVRQRGRRPLADPAAGAAASCRNAACRRGRCRWRGSPPSRRARARRPASSPVTRRPSSRSALASPSTTASPACASISCVDRRLVALAVGLDAGAAHRGALAGVEHPIVDRGVIRGARDQAVEGVDLADQMALAEPAHGRVARHRADLVAAEADQRHRRAHAAPPPPPPRCRHGRRRPR